MNGNEAMAKDMEAKHVPGVGQADREVDQKDRTEMTTRQDLANSIADLQRFSAANSGSMNPAVINEGNAKALLVQDKYRRAAGQGVFREAEKDFVNQISSSNPTQFFAKYRSGEGYQELGRDNLQSLNAVRTSYGLPPVSMPTSPAMANQTVDAAKAWLQKNPNDPKAATIRSLIKGR
jgi:hypothetical protein